MAQSRTVVMESRPMDAHYDVTYTGPFTQSFTDKRVLSKVSTTNMVTGTSRYKYFRRPIISQITPVSPNVLLAPKNEDPLVPVVEETEPSVKSVEVQTMYRDGEAQTNPYTPEYTIKEGQDPEILLLKDLTYENGLPLSKKELELVQHARLKRLLESNVPPFTDEASLLLRKALMEKQELKELKFRENEIDAKREERLDQLRQALLNRDENNEFLSAQRIEAIRQTRMDEREKQLEKIRSKRIKVLRRLANQRSKVDPILHETNSRSIIDDHFDRSSFIYAPKKREGIEHKTETTKFDVDSRTMTYRDIHRLTALESTIPRPLNPDEGSIPSPIRGGELFSKTAPAILAHSNVNHLLEERLTSASRRDLKNTKRDVDEMNRIIQNKKKAAAAQLTSSAVNSASDSFKANRTSTEVNSTASPVKVVATSRRAKGRPITPDLTVDDRGETIVNDNQLQAAVIILQSIIRGRAVQNIMIEGRYRRKELIAELRATDEFMMKKNSESDIDKSTRLKKERDANIRSTTEAMIVGAVTSNLLHTVAVDSLRVETLKQLQEYAKEAIEDRRMREAAETGRRQRDHMMYPSVAVNDDAKSGE